MTEPLQLPGETWKPIPGFDGYEVSDLGRVRSYRKRTLAGWITSDHPQRVLAPGSIAGHPFVNLSRNGNRHVRKIYELVLRVFVGECPEGMGVRHLDGNLANNRLENLRYHVFGEPNTLVDAPIPYRVTEEATP